MAFSCAKCLEIRSLNLLEPLGPAQTCMGIAFTFPSPPLLFFFWEKHTRKQHFFAFRLLSGQFNSIAKHYSTKYIFDQKLTIKGNKIWISTYGLTLFTQKDMLSVSPLFRLTCCCWPHVIICTVVSLAEWGSVTETSKGMLLHDFQNDHLQFFPSLPFISFPILPRYHTYPTIRQSPLHNQENT